MPDTNNTPNALRYELQLMTKHSPRVDGNSMTSLNALTHGFVIENIAGLKAELSQLFTIAEGGNWRLSGNPETGIFLESEGTVCQLSKENVRKLQELHVLDA